MRTWSKSQKFSFLSVLVLFLSTVGVLGWDWYDCLPAGLSAEYVGRQNCAQCHQHEHDLWQGSHHDLAMDHATPETVLGDFNDATFTKDGVTSRFFTKDGKYFVHTKGRGGKMETFELKYTFGVHPLQQYLAVFPQGRLQALFLAWDVEKKEWFDVSLDEDIQPDEPVYWTNRGMNWNFMCAECHSTNLQKNYDPKTNSYDTTWSEIDVSCEACHGPGSVHEKVVKRNVVFRDRRYGTGLAYLKGTDNDVQVDACGKCHARKRMVHPGFRPGDRFVDHYMPALLDTPAYYADGQILEEDYVYSSFHLSLMYHKDVKCTDCHDPHTTKLKAQGNNLCTQCHVAGKYDAPSHHFHKTGSTGALCVECHMPETTYMKVDPRRDHSFRIPRPELTLSLDIPNACNRCHDDKDAQWALAATDQWYGERKYERRIDFAQTIAAGRDAKPEAEAELVRLARDTRLPTYLRSSALSLLHNYRSDDVFETCVATMKDPSPLLRSIALRTVESRLEVTPSMTSLASGGGRAFREGTILRIAEMLDDESPAVRSEAARVLASLPTELIPSRYAQRYDEELRVFVQTQLKLSDDPGPNLTLANLYDNLGNDDLAEKYYKRALQLDPSYNPGRFNLGMLYSKLGRRDDAIAVFTEALAWEEKLRDRDFEDPRIIEHNRALLHQAHYSLGLLYAENPDQIPKSVDHFKKALEYDPSRHRVKYNLGLAYQHLQQPQEAMHWLKEAYRADPKQNDFAMALAILYSQQGMIDPSRQLLEAILSRQPDHVGAYQMLQQLEAQRSAPGSK